MSVFKLSIQKPSWFEGDWTKAEELILSCLDHQNDQALCGATISEIKTDKEVFNIASLLTIGKPLDWSNFKFYCMRVGALRIVGNGECSACGHPEYFVSGIQGGEEHICKQCKTQSFKYYDYET